jgi:hypothetical protein
VAAAATDQHAPEGLAAFQRNQGASGLLFYFFGATDAPQIVKTLAFCALLGAIMRERA